MKRAFLSFCILFLSACAAYSTLVTFDSDASTAAIVNSIGSSKVTSGISGGLSGTPGGQLDAQFTNDTLPTITGFTAGSANPIFTTSIYFRFATPTSSAGGAMISVGLSGSATTDAFATTGKALSIAGITKTSFSNSFAGYTATYLGNGSGSTTGPALSLTDGAWYYLALNASWNSTTGHYALQLNINNSDDQGTLGSSLYSITFNDSLGAANYSNGVHPFFAFSGPVSQMGVAMVDNFYVSVPEPSVEYFGLAGLVVLFCSRRFCIRFSSRHQP